MTMPASWGWNKESDGAWSQGPWRVIRQDRIGINSALWRVLRVGDDGFINFVRNKNGHVVSFRSVAAALSHANRLMRKEESKI